MGERKINLLRISFRVFPHTLNEFFKTILEFGKQFGQLAQNILLIFHLRAGASPTKRDYGRGLTAAQWSHYCGRHVCGESIEKFVRTAMPGGNGSGGSTGGHGNISAAGSNSGSGKTARQNKDKKKKSNRYFSSSSSFPSFDPPYLNLLASVRTSVTRRKSPNVHKS